VPVGQSLHLANPAKFLNFPDSQAVHDAELPKVKPAAQEQNDLSPRNESSMHCKKLLIPMHVSLGNETEHDELLDSRLPEPLSSPPDSVREALSSSPVKLPEPLSSPPDTL
jgi:hypothetical protein